MDREQKRFLEQHFEAAQWPKPAAARAVKNLRLSGSELPRWTLNRAERDDSVSPPVIRSLWTRGESMREVLSVDVFECSSARAARDQLLETLGNMQSGEIQRRTGNDSVGDISFGLNNTMVVFLLGNLVLQVRNAGPSVVQVIPAARELEKNLRPNAR